MARPYTIRESWRSRPAGIPSRSIRLPPGFRRNAHFSIAVPRAEIGTSWTGGKEKHVTRQTDDSQQWPKVTMYTTSWCPDCRASKRFLASKGIPFTEVDIEAQPAAAEVVRKLNGGAQRVPTIVID